MIQPRAYRFGAASKRRLAACHPDLIRVAERAIAASPIDFSITCGSRTIAEQRALVAKGASRTLASKHLIQNDGFSHAFDICCFEEGGACWDLPLYQRVARVMLKAAEAERVLIRWGGSWTRSAEAFSQTFIDGPHFEIIR